MKFEKSFKDGDLTLRNKYGLFSKKDLKAQLKEDHLTVKRLGERYLLKDYQMVHVLRVLDLTFRNPVNDTRVLDSSISPSLHQVLIGTLLGDGSMLTPKSFYVGHGLNQIDYCYHLAERLHQFVASFGDKDVKARTKKSFEFWTYRHDVFKPYYERFYSRGKHKKHITEKSAFDLNPEGLAYWTMDDGKFNEYGYYLCVGKINPEEGLVLVNLLKNNFGLNSNIQAQHKEKGHYNLYIQANSRQHFIDLISPYVIPSMMYKLKGESPPDVPFSIDGVVSRHRQLCKEANRHIGYSGEFKIEQHFMIPETEQLDSL
jgi:LAGLIDADG DNA endonuclease family.